MQRVVDTEVDSDFNLHTSYHNDFFVLRTTVLVNGENTSEIGSVKEGSYENPVMKFCHGDITINVWLIVSAISPVLHDHGVYHVNTFYYEQSPLFHVEFRSETDLKKFLLEIGDVEHRMEVELLSMLSKILKTERLAIIVQPELYLVSPNREKPGEAELYLMTAENCSDFVDRWKDSKLFTFASLHWKRGMYNTLKFRVFK